MDIPILFSEYTDKLKIKLIGAGYASRIIDGIISPHADAAGHKQDFVSDHAHEYHSRAIAEETSPESGLYRIYIQSEYLADVVTDHKAEPSSLIERFLKSTFGDIYHPSPDRKWYADDTKYYFDGQFVLNDALNLLLAYEKSGNYRDIEAQTDALKTYIPHPYGSPPSQLHNSQFEEQARNGEWYSALEKAAAHIKSKRENANLSTLENTG